MSFGFNDRAVRLWEGLVVGYDWHSLGTCATGLGNHSEVLAWVIRVYMCSWVDE
jgi:hypothetical protein